MNTGITIHKGLIVGLGEHPGLVQVWIPTDKGDVPLGISQYLHANTGSALQGDALEAARATAQTCRVATPLKGGAWFKEVPQRSASVFNHWYREGDPIYDYRLVDYRPSHTNGLPLTLTYHSDTPAQSLCALAPTLNVCGGTPLADMGNIPPGDFPILQTNQWVLVAYINSSNTPFVIGSIPSDEAWKTMV